MNIKEFHKKLKQHCDKLNGDCTQCCFVDYCYSQARDIYDDFLEEITHLLSTNEEDSKGISSGVIRNRHNVFPLLESN